MTYTKIQGILTTFILLIDIIWIGSSSVHLQYSKIELVVFSLFFVFYWGLYFCYENVSPLPKIIIFIQSLVLIFLYTKFSLILSYLGYTTNQPLVNETLGALDKVLGFDSPSLFYWFQAHSSWNEVLTNVYESLKLQLIIIIVYFSFFRNPVYLQRFIMLFMLSILLTIFIGALWPAVGTYEAYGFAPDETQKKVLQQFYELRKNIVNTEGGVGIVEFPSFHTTVALMFMYIFRTERKFIFISFIIFNSIMIFSCLSQGGHYLIDIIGGFGVFFLCAGAEGLFFRKMVAPSKNQAGKEIQLKTKEVTRRHAEESA